MLNRISSAVEKILIANPEDKENLLEKLVALAGIQDKLPWFELLGQSIGIRGVSGSGQAKFSQVVGQRTVDPTIFWDGSSLENVGTYRVEISDAKTKKRLCTVSNLKITSLPIGSGSACPELLTQEREFAVVVTAIDANRDAIASSQFTINVDNTSPTLSADMVSYSGPLNDGFAEFEFSIRSNDSVEAAATTCALDGQIAEPCSGAVKLRATAGAHSLTVYALDGGSNASTLVIPLTVGTPINDNSALYSSESVTLSKEKLVLQFANEKSKRLRVGIANENGRGLLCGKNFLPKSTSENQNEASVEILFTDYILDKTLNYRYYVWEHDEKGQLLNPRTAGKSFDFSSFLNLPPTAPVLSNALIFENSLMDAEVGTLLATDPNAGDSVSFKIADGSPFRIDGNVLRAKAPLDYETQNSYTILIEASDGIASTSAIFFVTVLNVNEAPTGMTLSASSVNENSAIGTVVGSLSTTDADGGSFIYSLVSGTGSTDNASFEMSSNTLRTAAVFDYQTKNTFSVRVRSTDAGGLGFEKVFAVTVTATQSAWTAVDAGTNLSVSFTSATTQSKVFSANAGDAIVFSMGSSSSFDKLIRVEDSNSNVVCSYSSTSTKGAISGICTIPQTGTYTFRAKNNGTGSNSTIGTFFENLTNPSPATVGIQKGINTSVSFANGNMYAKTFSATANDAVLMSMGSNDNYSKLLQIVRSNGTVVCSQSAANTQGSISKICTIPSTGSYTLLASADGSSSYGAATVTIYFENLTNFSANTAGITSGNGQTGTLANGDVWAKNFTANAGSTVNVSMTAAQAVVKVVKIVAQDGTVVCTAQSTNSTAAASSSCTIPSTGTYLFLALSDGATSYASRTVSTTFAIP